MDDNSRFLAHDQQAAESLRRIDRLVNRMFLVYSDATNRQSVICDEVVEDASGSQLVITARATTYLLGPASILENRLLSSGGKLAALSLNQCTSVLEVFALPMAFLNEGLTPSIEIHEAHIDSVQSDRKVVFNYVSEGSTLQTGKVASLHSMFRITATTEHNSIWPREPTRVNGTGAYLDPTAAQYGRDPGLKDASDYHTNHPGSKTVTSTSLGYWYYGYPERKLKISGRSSSRPAYASIDALEKKAYIRTLNNILYEVIEEVGGREVLFDMSPEDFEATLNNMADQARPALSDLAGELYDLERSLPRDMALASPADLERYQVVVDQCMGAGHEEFLRALERRVPYTWEYHEDGQVYQWS